MPTTYADPDDEFEDDDDEGDEDDDGSAGDDDAASVDTESVDTEPCPYCGEPIYEQAEVCPHCRSYISREDSRVRQPMWIMIGVIVTLAVVIVVWVLSRRV